MPTHPATSDFSAHELTPQMHPFMSVPWLIEQRLQADPSSVCIERKSSFGSLWEKISIAHFHADITRVARGLRGLGIQPGQSIAIFASTSYTWSVIDAAALSIGIVVVPIYESDSIEQICWILRDSQVRLVFTDTPERALSTQAAIEKNAAHAHSTENITILPPLLMDADGLASLERAGAHITHEEILHLRHQVTAESLATIIYTSGTTGKPKGVELTHGNIVFSTLSVLECEKDIINTAHTRVLLFLPLAHIMARIVFYYAISGKGLVGHVANTANLVSDLSTFRPTALLVVPRVLEKVYNAAEAKTGGGVKLKIFRWAAKIAEKKSVEQSRGDSTLLNRLQSHAANWLVWKKMRAILGPQCRFAVSAGAPLGKRLGHVYRGIGLTVVEAYGLTETTGPSTVNRVDNTRMGSVGLPMPGTRVRISSEGEVELSGPHIMRGYHNNHEATSRVITDGWFKTGDIGEMDEDGFLQITGRKKDLIVTAGGKNVAPAVLEDPLSGHPLISHVVVVGDKKPFVGALITLDPAMLPSWLANHGLSPMSIEEAAKHPRIRASLDAAIERTNKLVSRAESIRKYIIVPGVLTVENGMLTPSLKVKREKVRERYSWAIEELYSSPKN